MHDSLKISSDDSQMYASFKDEREEDVLNLSAK